MFRVPDDASDLIDHRNGRFINNVFVPNDPVARKSPHLKLPGTIFLCKILAMLSYDRK